MFGFLFSGLLALDFPAFGIFGCLLGIFVSFGLPPVSVAWPWIVGWPALCLLGFEFLCPDSVDGAID